MRDNIKINHTEIEEEGGGSIVFRIFLASQESWDISCVERSGSVLLPSR